MRLCRVCVCVFAALLSALCCAVLCVVVGAVGRSSGGAEEWQQEQCASGGEA